jgi:malonyl CoA-acyl carrier protein transacylase
MEYLKQKNSIIIECGPGKVLTGIAKSNELDYVISTSADDHLEILKSLL